jgi:hypothetical protein
VAAARERLECHREGGADFLAVGPFCFRTHAGVPSGMFSFRAFRRGRL